jgi:ribose transport system permease protein
MKALAARLSRPWAWSFLGAVLVFVLAVSFTGGAGAGGMITTALALAVFTIVVGLGQMIVITLGPGNVDLSLPANIGLASAVSMTVMNGSDSLVGIGLLAALGCGLAIGVANYLLIRALGIPPIVATLSSSFVVQSIDIAYGRGLQIKPPDGFADFVSLQIGGIPVCAILAMLLSAGFGIALRRTIYGRSLMAVGQNPRAAQFAGLALERTRLITYGLCGMLGGLDGALLAGYFRGANVDLGNEYLLSSIAVVVIGGTSVAGGKPSVPGIWGASLFLILLLTMLNTFGVSAGVRLVATGLVIVAVIAIAGNRGLVNPSPK